MGRIKNNNLDNELYKGDLISIYKNNIPALVLSDCLEHGSIHVMYLSGTKKKPITTHIYTHYINNILSKCKE